jgi:hypothetical protein
LCLDQSPHSQCSVAYIWWHWELSQSHLLIYYSTPPIVLFSNVSYSGCFSGNRRTSGPFTLIFFLAGLGTQLSAANMETCYDMSLSFELFVFFRTLLALQYLHPPIFQLLLQSFSRSWPLLYAFGLMWWLSDVFTSPPILSGRHGDSLIHCSSPGESVWSLDNFHLLSILTCCSISLSQWFLLIESRHRQDVHTKVRKRIAP